MADLRSLAFLLCVLRCSSAEASTSSSSNVNVSDTNIDLLSGHPSHAGTIYFNNPHLLQGRRGFLKDGNRASSQHKTFNSENENIGGIYIQDEAKIIASHLRRVSNDELGITAMQTILDKLPFVTSTLPNEEELLEEMSLRMGTKLSEYVELLHRNQDEAELLFAFRGRIPPSQIFPCCPFDKDSLRYSDQFGMKLPTDYMCDTHSFPAESSPFNAGQNLSIVFEQNYKLHPTIKWQYFLSAEGIHLDHLSSEPNDDMLSGCRLGEDDSRHRELYWATVLPQPKRVVILLDHGNSLSPTQLSTGKAVAKTVLSTLSHHDKVSVISLAGHTQYPRPSNVDCLASQMIPATFEAKISLNRFIEFVVKANEPTDHTLGIVKAFEIIRSTLQSEGNASNLGEATIVYISRGLLNSLTEAKTVLSTIAAENSRLDCRVVLNTFVLIDDNKPIMYEKRFMQDIADQNFKKYDVLVPTCKNIKRGVMIAVNSTKHLSAVLPRFYSVMTGKPGSVPKFFPPYWDPVGKGLVVSIMQACVYHNQIIGVVGIDIHVADIVEDATYFHLDQHSYAFITDVNGNTIMHPAFGRTSFASEQLMDTDILHLESKQGFHLIRKDILETTSGREKLVLSQTNNDSDSTSVSHHTRITYTWKRVPETPFVICIVRQESESTIQLLKSLSVPANSDASYHRLDLSPAPKMCQHLKQLATVEMSSLFLSPGSFLTPFEYLSQEETKRNVQSYMAFLSDGTKLIANPGLKPSVRNDVAAIVRITSEWRERFYESDLTKYIIRRYIATPSGAFLMHPGSVMDRAYDPTKRPWYLRALEYPSQVVVTAPYLDVGGAGYIVTVSHTVFEGKPASLHSPSDGVVAVMGIDFTLGYFYKLLLEFIPICTYDRIVCFVLDDRGYLITHPGLVEPNGRGPVEQQHITHKEPLVANDILNHKGFVTKKVCNSLSDRTIQRFYEFNTSLDRVLTNLVHGEHCSKYQIAPIPGTNIFLGIVNQTCDMVTAFCPCSTVDRLCLNCHRMEQSECECPCECPLEMDLCNGHPLGEDDVHPSCPPIPDDIRLFNVNPVLLEKLPQCFESKCSARNSESDCFGVMDCEWCQLDSDGVTALKRPFCSQQRKCFGGVLGAQTPYADEIVGLPLEEFMTIKSSPVGPVAGGIMGCFLVLLLAVYFYRQHTHRLAHNHYSSTLPETAIRMSHLDNEADDPEPQEHFLRIGYSNEISFENRPNVSPYHMNPSYRRPTGGDSDHGYSTMTPHDDSEYQPSVETNVLGKDRYRPGGTTQSVASSSRASSPAPPPPLLASSLLVDLSQTVIPTNVTNLCHQTILTPVSHRHTVPVQVHMVDTH